MKLSKFRKKDFKGRGIHRLKIQKEKRKFTSNFLKIWRKFLKNWKRPVDAEGRKSHFWSKSYPYKFYIRRGGLLFQIKRVFTLTNLIKKGVSGDLHPSWQRIHAQNCKTRTISNCIFLLPTKSRNFRKNFGDPQWRQDFEKFWKTFCEEKEFWRFYHKFRKNFWQLGSQLEPTSQKKKKSEFYAIFRRISRRF